MTSKGVLLKINCNQLLASICLGALILLASATQPALAFMRDWTDSEKWVWEKIKAGEPADFNVKEELSDKATDPEKKEFDPRQRGRWHAGRIISEGFLKDILFRKEYRNKIRFEGVQIIGAHFEEPVKLPRFDIDFQLVLEKCWFERAVDFTNIIVKKRLSFDGSYTFF